MDQPGPGEEEERQQQRRRHRALGFKAEVKVGFSSRSGSRLGRLVVEVLTTIENIKD